ncbi:MAG: hypothetical protein M3347_08755, partial [Armatimonadota bacterium]|nr:hypothetical protein [Armatimonadota bacterium]
TTVDLLHFDFQANPDLRLEIFDQDEDDAARFDNVVDYNTRGVGHITRLLNTRFRATRRGSVVAAWNGVFFGYYHRDKEGLGFHVAPVVLRGQVYYTKINRRWTFGVQYRDARPVFKVLHLPDRATLAREFDFAAASAQCLIQNGKPLKIQPYPASAAKILKAPVPSTPQEIGHVPIFDHMQTSRVSWAWSRDNRQLYLIVVKEPDNEMASILAFRHNQPQAGGWTVPDLQRFWQAMVRANTVWNAVNSDAGGVAQLAYRLPDGKYALLPGTPQRLVFTPNFKNAPSGGSIMFFYVRDAKG